MSTNRQPIDRVKALNGHVERAAVACDEARDLYERDALPVYVSHSKHGHGKIGGVASINTAPTIECLLRWIQSGANCVCKGCYANGLMMTARQNVTRRAVHNSYVMSRPLKGREWAIPRGLIGPVRFNAYGEIINEHHVQWVLAIARANPRATFSIITKRPELFPMQRRPRNLVITASHYLIGDMSISPWADKTYLVQRGEATEEQKRDPNLAPCQDHCLTCYLHRENCYSKKGPKGIVREYQESPTR